MWCSCHFPLNQSIEIIPDCSNSAAKEISFWSLPSCKCYVSYFSYIILIILIILRSFSSFSSFSLFSLFSDHSHYSQIILIILIIFILHHRIMFLHASFFMLTFRYRRWDPEEVVGSSRCGAARDGWCIWMMVKTSNSCWISHDIHTYIICIYIYIRYTDTQCLYDYNLMCIHKHIHIHTWMHISVYVIKAPRWYTSICFPKSPSLVWIRHEL